MGRESGDPKGPAIQGLRGETEKSQMEFSAPQQSFLHHEIYDHKCVCSRCGPKAASHPLTGGRVSGASGERGVGGWVGNLISHREDKKEEDVLTQVKSAPILLVSCHL